MATPELSPFQRATLAAPIAPRWHTALLVGLYVSVAAAGLVLQRHGSSASALPGVRGRTVAVYLPLLLVQWSLVYYVARVGRPASALGALLGVRGRTLTDTATDLALAATGWLTIKLTEYAWLHWAAVSTPPAVTAMLPHTVTERLAWAVVSLSVGFCEEVVFRGYLLTQFEAFARRAWVAVALQAVIFGMAHGEQGGAAMLRAGAYGVGFGVLARWRRSLVPGIVCHVGIDLASGLLRV